MTVPVDASITSWSVSDDGTLRVVVTGAPLGLVGVFYRSRDADGWGWRRPATVVATTATTAAAAESLGQKVASKDGLELSRLLREHPVLVKLVDYFGAAATTSNR